MNVEAQWKAVEVIFRSSMLCHKCFEQHLVEASLVDIAQPRWIGENYFSAAMRVVVIGLNPGAGNARDKEKANRPFRQVLYAYRDVTTGTLWFSATAYTPMGNTSRTLCAILYGRNGVET